MKERIIKKINEKKDQTGAEAFFLLCAQADKLSTDFQRTFRVMLRQFTEIEKLEEDKKKREQAIFESYTSLVMNPNFHNETAELINEKNKKTHKEKHSSSTPPPNPRPGGGTGQSERKDVVNEAAKTDDVDKSVVEQSTKSSQSSTSEKAEAVKEKSVVKAESSVVEEAALKIDALRKPITPPAGSR